MLLPPHHRRNEALRKHLKKLRRDAGLTQAELGTRLKVEQSLISKVERGERAVELLLFVDWCRACRQSPEAVLAEHLKSGS